MFLKSNSVKSVSLLGMLALIAALLSVSLAAATDRAHALAGPQPSSANQCVSCHEDLYYLHDTGKSFCLQQAQMECVDCHGGDPAATTKEAAHFDRAKHPVTSGDESRCYQCHPAQAEVRLEKFRQVAGISNVKFAEPYQPVASVSTEAGTQPAPAQPALNMEFIALIVAAALALTTFIVYKIRHG